MSPTPPQVSDPQRLEAVEATGLMDTPPEEAFDRLVELAAVLIDAPLAFVTLVDDQRSFWKASVGIPEDAERQNPVGESFCQYVIGSDEALIVGDAAADPRTRDNPSINKMGVAAWAGFPVRGPTGEVLGSFCVVDTAVRTWSERDVEILETLSHAAAGEIALRQAAATAERHARDFLREAERSASLARTLQESLLPPHLPAIPGIDIDARYLPGGAGEVLGDFYDVFQTGPTSWGVVLGDVSGKGVQAAQVTALARYTIRAAAMHERSPAGILKMLNAALMFQQPHGDEGFLTVVYAAIRYRQGRVNATLCSAGHTPALLRSGKGAVRTVGAHGMPLGMFADPRLTDTRVRLPPGSVLLLYTDGVTEARCGSDQYGQERLVELLRNADHSEASAVTGAVMKQVAAFSGHATPTDDTAVLALRVPEA